MMQTERKVGTHGFHGSCAPQGGRTYFGGQRTFSVGCFQWEPCSSGNGFKKGPVKVRVSGPVDRWEQVEARAREICAQLDAGTYAGPKNAKV